MTAAATVLRRTAQLYSDGTLTWGTEWFVSISHTCRCVLGGIAYAVDPDNADGNPFLIGGAKRPLAVAAVEGLATYIAEELYRGWHRDENGQPDLVETVGGWNDDQRTTVADVITALLDAAASLDRTAVPA